jgi:hypothetical protein
VNRNLAQRLKQLEVRLAPAVKPRRWEIRFINPKDRSVSSTLIIENGRQEWHGLEATKMWSGGNATLIGCVGRFWQEMAGSKTKLGHKKEEAIVALLSQRSVEDAARACNTPVRTLHRWMKEPDFDAAFRAARRNAFGQSISRLQQGSAAAATTLLKVMVDAATPASTRVRAAEAVLSHAAKAIEIEDIEARLAALEQSAPQGSARR